MDRIILRVEPEKAVKEQKDLFGIFFEDISHAADGGLYGELVRNRSFEFDHTDNPSYHGMTAWQTVEHGDSIVQAHIESIEPLNASNPHFLRVEVTTAGEGGGISNEGYGEGIPVEKGRSYRFSCYYRCLSGKGAGLSVCLENAEHDICYGEAAFRASGEGWTYLELTLTAEETDYAARLTIQSREAVEMDFDMVSLFPVETFLGRRNGLRKGLAELLRDMKPAFLRFPGGCLAHIGSLRKEDRNGMYRFSNTLGPVEQRPGRRNSWQYHQTLGLGYYEFFQFCEDIGAEPLPVIAAGYDPHFLRMAEGEQREEWIQEALGIIEFARGDAAGGWGSVRAKMGHPEPFGLKYLGIGNEEAGDGYYGRYEEIAAAVKERYPDIELIASGGAFCSGSEYRKGWETARRTGSSFVDEHFYQSREWYIANAHRYEERPETGAKVFLGEYASHENKWENALAEAAFMVGLEKSRAVGLACYAPLLCHVDYRNWPANLIFYDNHRCYGTPNYYVQKLFMNYQGKELVEAAAYLQESVQKWGQASAQKREQESRQWDGIQKQEQESRQWDGVQKQEQESGQWDGAQKQEQESEQWDGVQTGEERISSFQAHVRYPELSGNIALKTTNGHVKVYDLTIKNIEDGSVRKYGELELTPEQNRIELGYTDSSRYEIAFAFCREKGKLRTDLDGIDSFMLEFAGRDGENYLQWVLAGWQRMTLLQGFSRNMPCGMEAYLCSLKPGQTYQARLVAEDSHVTVFIDGKEYCSHTFREPVPDRLYYSAVKDGERVYVKAVNVEAESKELRICVDSLKGTAGTAEVICMENIPLDAVNSLEEPERVVPIALRIPVVDGHLIYEMKPYSFCVFCLEREEAV